MLNFGRVIFDQKVAARKTTEVIGAQAAFMY
jgi:hypothetical protein